MVTSISQKVWTTLVLTTQDVTQAKKRFLSRTARYSGLLNILEFQSADLLSESLMGANAWIAFDVARDKIIPFSESAITAGIKRILFTTKLSSDELDATVVPEFDEAVAKFEAAGASFTGIRHGDIVEGTEDNPYNIVNSSFPLESSIVERGVLSRVVSELMLIPAAANVVCGVSSANTFAAAYLNILRSTGLSRTQEVERLFAGGVQKIGQRVRDGHEEKKKEQVKAKELEEKRKVTTPSVCCVFILLPPYFPLNMVCV